MSNFPYHDNDPDAHSNIVALLRQEGNGAIVDLTAWAKEQFDMHNVALGDLQAYADERFEDVYNRIRQLNLAIEDQYSNFDARIRELEATQSPIVATGSGATGDVVGGNTGAIWWSHVSALANSIRYSPSSYTPTKQLTGNYKQWYRGRHNQLRCVVTDINVTQQEVDYWYNSSSPTISRWASSWGTGNLSVTWWQISRK